MTERPPVDPLRQIGAALLALGVLLLIVGAALYFGGKIGLGRLPGDLSFSGEGWGCFVPVTTMLLLSLLLTLVLNLIARWWR